jgi:hypothetical protein
VRDAADVLETPPTSAGPQEIPPAVAAETEARRAAIATAGDES